MAVERHKDNKAIGTYGEPGWVTEFISALTLELDAAPVATADDQEENRYIIFKDEFGKLPSEYVASV